MNEGGEYQERGLKGWGDFAGDQWSAVRTARGVCGGGGNVLGVAGEV